MTENIIGMDPGQSGGMTLLDPEGGILSMHTFKATDHDIACVLRAWIERRAHTWAFIESVHSMPRQGVASSFKFGRHFGFLLGLLTAMQVPYELVTPQKWQRAMCCMSKGDKNITKAAAQRIWPHENWTHALADSALIAEYGRRQWRAEPME